MCVISIISKWTRCPIITSLLRLVKIAAYVRLRLDLPSSLNQTILASLPIHVNVPLLQTMGPQLKKVLLFTSSERGQANVVLATAHTLIQRRCSVHVASFSPLASRVRELTGATFHQLHGESMREALLHHFNTESQLIHGTGVREATRMYPLLMKLVCVWEGDEYIQGYLSAKKIIEEVEPDVVVVEKLCAQAMDACKKLGRNFVLLSPVTFKETLVAVQPWGYGLWGWPAYVQCNLHSSCQS
jgi:hypothetical protein